MPAITHLNKLLPKDAPFFLYRLQNTACSVLPMALVDQELLLPILLNLPKLLKLVKLPRPLLKPSKVKHAEQHTKHSKGSQISPKGKLILRSPSLRESKPLSKDSLKLNKKHSNSINPTKISCQIR